MNERFSVRVATSLSGLAEEDWNRLVGEHDPFVEYGFLSALERSGSVGAGTGWQPLHVTAWSGDRLVGALPLYLKDHSFGEYIFDWAWADAARRIGSPYYPKLVSMVPVTPATGRRFLADPSLNFSAVVNALMEGALGLAEQLDASSLHLLFLTEQEQKVALAVGEAGLFHGRLGFQYHFVNEGYGDFDAFLAACRSTCRKQMRRERRCVAESGLSIEVKDGPSLTHREWISLASFYRDTCARRGSAPYLTRAFFEELEHQGAERVVCALAYREGQVVAGTLNFEKGDHLYGRYWGASEDHEFLHFELCYYRLMERVIDKGMKLFEAGAQGTHKLRRGFLPRPVYSAHALRNPVLQRAVAEFLPREAELVREEMRHQAEHGPFRRGTEFCR